MGFWASPPERHDVCPDPPERCFREPLDDAVNRIFRLATGSGMRDPLAPQLGPTLTMRLSATEYVASLAWFASAAFWRLRAHRHGPGARAAGWSRLCGQTIHGPPEV